MKRINSEKILQDVFRVSKRFPLTLILIVLLTIWQLSRNDFFFAMEPMHLVFGFGILFSMTSQLFYERFFKENEKMRWVLKGVVVGLIGLYYYYLTYSLTVIDGGWTIYSIPGIRSMILFFLGTILFIWVPTIKNNIKFSESFLVTFKAYFSTLFFSIILFLGIFLTFALFEFLFFTIDFNWGLHTSTLVFNFFAPIFFLTNIPKDYIEGETTAEAATMPKFLHYLISYIFVPIMGVLTGIIVLYIVTNITNDFFTDNILEGLLLSYTISGWILLLLTDAIDNNPSKWFRKIFPYLLIFVIVLQMISTFLQIQDVGVTHGRYFILLFGVGSVISGLWYLLKGESLRILPLVAVVSGLIVLIPPVDAMSIAVNQQRNRIETVLNEYEMFDAEGEIVANPEVPAGEQETVLESLDYLSEISALNQLGWLPQEQYHQRDEYLGFESVTDIGGYTEDVTATDVYSTDNNINFSVTAYEQLLDLSLTNESTEFLCTIEMSDQTVDVSISLEDELVVSITSEDGGEAQVYDFSYVLDEFEGAQGETFTQEELTFVEGEGDEEVQMIIKNLYRSGDYLQIDFFLMF